MSSKIKDISILIVEDEDELREEIAEYIGLFFSNIYQAQNSTKAYELYQKIKPDIILSDVNMPDGSGLEFIAKIRQKDMLTKIIVLSAHSDQEKLLDAIKLHLEAYLVKPLNLEKLKEMLLELCKKIVRTTLRAHVSEFTYWDYKGDTLWHKDSELELKNKERLLLRLLFSKPNHIFSTKEIFEYLHRDKTHKKFSSYAITSLIKRIRNALPEDIIQNIYGAGYKVSVNQ